MNRPNHALQRTWPSRSDCIPRLPWTGLLSLIVSRHSTRVGFYRIILVASAYILSGCATTNVLTQNKKAAHNLALLFKVYDNSGTGDRYPATLRDLTTQLAAHDIE